jgi:hypothetical protein
MMEHNTVMHEFTERIADRIFDGFLPMNVPPGMIARAVLQSLPAFKDADVEVRRHFLAEMTRLIWCRQAWQAHAANVDGSAGWKS